MTPRRRHAALDEGRARRGGAKGRLAQGRVDARGKPIFSKATPEEKKFVAAILKAADKIGETAPLREAEEARST